MKIEKLRDRFFEGAPRYQWLETIGRGGMGIVFKAQDLELEDVVAIKVLSPDLESDDQELLARFKREINLNRKIKHPNVARIHDFGTSGDFPYITMEFIPGKDLRTLIADEGRLPPARAVSILRQIALGSNAAHRLGIIHRDLKSQNVMVEESGAVAILDFGLARGKLSEGLTLDSIMIGTPHYMSPEQALGRPTDARSDIYSIGVMGYEALTGHVPYTGESPLVIAMKHVSEPIPDDLDELTDVPADLIAIVKKAMAKPPDDRFSSAADMEAELAAVRLAAPASGEMRIPVLEPEAPAPPRPATPIPVQRLIAAEPRPAETAEPRGQAEGPKTPIAVHARAPVVLVVSADENHRMEMTRCLARSGCRWQDAERGTQALELVLQQPIDVVLMDADLPDMDGFDVTRVLKAQPALETLPIVLLSARVDRNRLAFGIQSGATDVLGLSLHPESVVTRIWDILQHRGFIPPAWSDLLSTTLRDALSGNTPPPVVRPRPS